MSLRLDGVDVAYGRTQVVFDVSLEVPAGSLVCLMGRNGVGKTTLLNAMMGVLPLSGGQVLLDGEDITRFPAHARARAGIGYVPQGHQVFPHLSVSENLRVVHERAGRADPSAIDDALSIFPALIRLLERPAGLLSGGQAQQLAIAGLHRSTGMSILLVEQYVEFALRLAERYGVMDAGRIVHDGETATADAAVFAELMAV